MKQKALCVDAHSREQKIVALATRAQAAVGNVVALRPAADS